MAALTTARSLNSPLCSLLVALTVRTMTTPEDAKDPFAEAQATFAPVISAPNDEDVKLLNEAFVNSLQLIDVSVGAVDLSNILLLDDNQKNQHGETKFERMEVPIQAYNDSIAVNANNAVRAKAESLWTANIKLQQLIKIVKCARSDFLVAVVKETWLLPLKEKSTFYNKMPLRDFFTHLKGGSGSLDATDIVSLLSAMLGWWANNPRVPEYMNHLKDTQKKFVQSKLPIDNMWLATIVTVFLLAAGSIPKQCPDWDSLPHANKA